MTDRSKRMTSVTSRWKTLLWMLGAGILLSAWPVCDWWNVLPEGRTANYVGRTACASCHQRQVEQWTGSDHDLAMDLATPEFVLGDFDNTQLEHHGVTSRLSHRDDKYFVETEGPDGKT
ncbi:MAG: hypothetical protein GY758_21745, partial [Fuerstiella sp.]|nr:hypothetical protein [Fuerstiella sp.]